MNSDDYYLDAMGIKRWHFRKEIVEDDQPTLSHYIYQLFQNGKLEAYLITEATLKTREEANLVEKIIKATKLEYKGGLAEEMPDTGVTKVIHLARSPAEMLKDPSLKREVWDKLKPQLEG